MIMRWPGYFKGVLGALLLFAAPCARADLAETDALIGQGRYEAALAELKRLPASVPENLVLYRQGMIALGLGRYDLAEEWFERLYLLDLDTPEVATGLAHALLAQGKMREGMAQMRQSARRYPDHPGTLAMLARFEDRMGQTAAALARIRAARARLGDAPELIEAEADIRNKRTPAMPRAIAGDAPDHSRPPAIHTAPAPEPAPAPSAAGPRPAQPLTAAKVTVTPTFDPILVPKGASVSTGSGFVIDQGRHVITNAHVVAGVQDIQVRNGLGKVRQARIAAFHEKEDLAVLALDTPFPAEWALSRGRIEEPAPGRVCAVMGYPLSDILGAKWPALTTGHVSRTQGSDPNLIEITAALNAGNSGGPVVDNHGRIIGVVVSKLDTLQFAQERGSLPQDVNFAVRPGLLQKVLAAVPGGEPATPPLREMDTETLYETMLPSVVLIVGVEKATDKGEKR